MQVQAVTCGRGVLPLWRPCPAPRVRPLALSPDPHCCSLLPYGLDSVPWVIGVPTLGLQQGWSAPTRSRSP